jgi:hypothetical protein
MTLAQDKFASERSPGLAAPANALLGLSESPTTDLRREGDRAPEGPNDLSPGQVRERTQSWVSRASECSPGLVYPQNKIGRPVGAA